jgi:nitroimidazol reductase NimA-like FMN-containing flavoprotein (pyridoxamine 5'-phosphate oxidase superfamily)
MESMPAEPAARLDARFSSPGAEAQPWESARRTVADAEPYWLATVRADGRPHITPLLGIWMDERIHFCTGPEEQKAKNLEGNDRCALLTGANVSDEKALGFGKGAVYSQTRYRFAR